MAKKNKKANKEIMAYFGSYLDAVQSTSIQGLSDPGATRDLVGKPLNVGLAPTADMSIDTTKAVGPDNQITNIDERAAALPNKALADMKAKQGKKPGMDLGNFEGINVKTAVGSILPFINALTGERDPVRTRPFEPLQVYNPHPQGTGSQALYENGGSVQAKLGMEINDPTNPKPSNEMYYQSSARLTHYKDLLNDKLKAKNPKAYGDFFSGLVDLRKKGDTDGANKYVQSTPYNEYLTPEEVKSTLGDEEYPNYLQSIQRVNDYNVAQGQQALYGSIEGENTIDNLNYGRRFAALQITPSITVKSKNGNTSKDYSRKYNYDSNAKTVGYTEDGDMKLRPDYLSKKKNGGKMDKAFWGAIAGAAQQVGGKITDQMKEQTKLAAQAPQEIMDFFAKAANFKDTFHPGGGYQPGPYVQPEQMLYDNGGSIGGENQIQLHGAGSLELLAGNPYDGGTVQFNGPSHANDGIPMSYGGKTIEAEGAETAVKDAQGNLHIMGNMKVPGSNIKFKSLSKKIAEKEEEYEHIKTKGVALVNTLDPHNKYDRLGFNSGTLMMNGGDLGQKDLAQKKQNLAALQNSILQTAEEYNLSPEHLAEGEVRKAKKGTYKAAMGIQLDPGPKKASVAERHNNPGNIKYGDFAKKMGAIKGEAATDGGNFAIFPDVETGLNAIRRLLQTKTYRNKPVEQAVKTWTGGAGYSKGAGQLAGKTIKNLSDGELDNLVDYITYGEDGKYFHGRTPGSPSRQSLIPKAPNVTPNPTAPENPYIPFDGFKAPNIPFSYKAPTPNVPVNPQAPGSPDVKLPQDRNIPSNVRGLNLAQLLPELAAIGNNRQETVPANQFVPLLEQPYQVSFQDRINENQATFNALSRQVGNNPLALSSLSANQYQADNSVLADEFRFNQGEANRVYNQNRNTTNQAEMYNLGVRDQQFVRQSQAKSNTKAQTNEILKSMSAKYLQNTANNQKLALYENLYNFRAQDTNKDGIDDKMVNYNPDASFMFSNSQGTGNSSYQRTREILDDAGRLKQKTVTNPSPREQQLIDLKIQKQQAEKPLLSIPNLFRKKI